MRPPVSVYLLKLINIFFSLKSMNIKIENNSIVKDYFDTDIQACELMKLIVSFGLW